MSIKTKIAALALASLAVAGSFATSTTKAEAYPLKPWHVGLATAAIVGTAVAASAGGPVYYTSYRRCGWQPRYNMFGQYIGSVRICTYPY
jgi:branched-subunit amino acid ABC-type transport system permease component